jgi:uncharacterized UBP type Zn finger protein
VIYDCEDLEEAALRRTPVEPGSQGCAECLESGDSWVHLRLCVACGHVGCCNNSKNKHASRHYLETQHPVIRSFEPGEHWAYCFRDDTYAERLPLLGRESAPVHYDAPGVEGP